MSGVGIGIVGCGYWGQNLTRNFWEADGAELLLACDTDPTALARIQRRYPTIQLATDYAAVLSDPRVEAVVLATPVSTHYAFARRALEAGKHVLVEKPLATSSEQVFQLMDLAERLHKILMVDHTFLYTGAVRQMKELIAAGEIGELLYYDSVRINLGLVQGDINVLWDLAPHDFSIMDYLCELDPVSVTAIAARHLDCPFENIAYVTVRFDSKFIAHFHLNWLAPVKVRTTLIGGTKKMIVYDDTQASEKVKVYDRGITINHDPERRERLLTGYRNGDMLAPQLDMTEALRLMVREFIHSIQENRPPLTDSSAGYRVVRLLEAAQQSIDDNGTEVVLSPPVIPRTRSLSAAATLSDD